MAVEATCRNILRYDKDAGQYVHCGCVFEVAEDQIGSIVECPDCGAGVEVLPPEPQQIDASPLDIMDDVVAESTQSQWTYQPPPEIEPARARTQLPCINCHTPIPVSAEICPECGYRQPDAEAEGPTGAQLWASSWLSDDASPWMILGLGSALLCVLGTLCLGYTAIEYGTGSALCLLSPLGLILGVLVLLLLAGRRRGEPLGAAAKRVLNPMSAVLLLCRASSWREPRWPFRTRRVLDGRDSQLGDRQLLDDEHLDRYEAVDLEGTQITDAGLDYLLTAKSLKFVVLRGTNTTAQGVRRLQNRRPHLWIWT